jgi:hypothetical protein
VRIQAQREQATREANLIEADLSDADARRHAIRHLKLKRLTENDNGEQVYVSVWQVCVP